MAEVGAAAGGGSRAADVLVGLAPMLVGGRTATTGFGLAAVAGAAVGVGLGAGAGAGALAAAAGEAGLGPVARVALRTGATGRDIAAVACPESLGVLRMTDST